jgi:hypothetical protein
MANIIWSEADLKEAIDAKPKQAADVKTWSYRGQFATGSAVATYLNTPTAQVAGEAIVSGNLGGPFDVFIFI